ncbi:Cobalt ABC transporter, permease protein CbiQ [Hyella patelloides LEGE 07179]|uniref:Cobalt ABC transporter, permease protein CbiQ n=1 Tax=Hyella patelloides LEGE 07179 TaxID=945734 RepID=A0A563VQE2_9CYAN|nr:cobalt ECF transporter T component CbiQ [Hyella patelloides]VEP13599.1 Cobalt ABC transporter, permease protein CbiQ [Hyella patelloides LEGE 07179]
MKLTIDRYAYLTSPIHSWQQTYKLIGLLGLIFAFSFVESLALLPILMAISAIFFILSRLPFGYLISRLRYPGWFILAVVFLLPFTVGNTTLLQWGWLSLKQEGCQTALLIVVRFFCILTLSLVLFGTAPFLDSIKALRILGLPKVIVDMTLLSYRYLEELGETLNTMQKALQLRGFNHHQLNRRYLQVLASLVGSLFVRSYERSNRIYHAMILRGYGSNYHQINLQKSASLSQFNRYNLWGTIVSLFLATSILVTEIFFLKS